MGPPKTGGSWWRGLTECGQLEKGMANHFSILALRTPWTVWKGKMIGYWKRNSQITWDTAFEALSMVSRAKQALNRWPPTDSGKKAKWLRGQISRVSCPVHYSPVACLWALKSFLCLSVFICKMETMIYRVSLRIKWENTSHLERCLGHSKNLVKCEMLLFQL